MNNTLYLSLSKKIIILDFIVESIRKKLYCYCEYLKEIHGRSLDGYWNKILLLFKLIFIFLCFIPSLFIVLFIRLIRPFVLIRFCCLPSNRIGHFAANVEMYLCERELGMSNPDSIDLFSCHYIICNYQLLKMWKKLLFIHPFVKYLYMANILLPGGRKHTLRLPSDRDIHNIIPEVKQHLFFTEDEEKKGEKYLLTKGLGINDKFVCLHARSDAYLNKEHNYQTKETWYRHKYRNSSIADYLKAADYLTQQGYYVFRVGSAVDEELQTENPMIIDYAANGDRSEFLDIFLMAKCYFMIGGGGGPKSIPFVFRRPVASPNEIPLEDIVPGYNDYNLSIPKKLYSEKEKRLLTFREIVESGAGKFYRTEQYDESGLKVIDNTPEEIKDLVIEINERIKGTWKETEEDNMMQEKYKKIIPESELNGKIKRRICSKFLQQNRELLK